MKCLCLVLLVGLVVRVVRLVCSCLTLAGGNRSLRKVWRLFLCSVMILVLTVVAGLLVLVDVGVRLCP